MTARPGNEPLMLTERLELWRPRAADLPGLVALLAPEEVRRYLGPARADPADQFARLLRNAGSWSLYGYGVFVLRLIGAPKIVGTCGVFRSWREFGRSMEDVSEIGWIIAREHWGEGIASEAAHAALAWFAATHRGQRVACMIENGNAASQRLAARLGFCEYDRFIPEGEYAELALYERLPDSR